jgi:DNA-binding SARP family transcriptional activator
MPDLAIPDLEVQLFSAFQVRHRGELVTTLTSPRQQALLAWLLLHGPSPQPRRHIAFALWPDSEEAQALTNLRRELHGVRRTLPWAEEFIEVTPSALRWRHDASFSLDTAALGVVSEVQAADLDALEEATRHYTGALLPALDDEWLAPLREALHQRATELLERLIEGAEGAGERTRALRHAQRLIVLEPLRERTYARLMRLQMDDADAVSARQTYARCVEVLRAELGVPPSEAVQALYRQLLGSAAAAPPTPPGMLPLIGRQSEWLRLVQVWQEVQMGTPRVVVISGEAGIGKTRLAEALLDLAGAAQLWTARTRSYAAEGRLAYAPISDWLRAPGLRTRVTRLERPWQGEVLKLVPEVVPQPNSPSGHSSPSEGWQRQRLFEALSKVFVMDHAPLLLLLDDLQWCDRDTLEWLHFLLRFDTQAPLLLICTLRREEQDANPAVRAFLRDLQERGLLDRIDLGALSYSETAALAESVLARELPEPARSQLFEATEGQPLFIVEAIRAGLDAGGEGAPQLFAPSARVQAVIAARLEQLSPEARGVSQLAATIGRAFDVEVLREASDLDEEQLVGALDELWQRAMIREQPGLGGHYDFSHDRLREGAYSGLSPARRRLLHRRVAQALELRHAPDLTSVAAQLAAHHEQAGQHEKAAGFYVRAAERANGLSASQEATRQGGKALRLLESLPPGPTRDRAELSAHNAMAAALCALKGFTPPELESTLNRALQLSESLGDETEIIRSLWGLFALQVVRGNVRLAHSLAERALSLVREDTGLMTDCHLALGGGDQIEGKLAGATEHFTLANRLYRQHRRRRVIFGSDVGVFSFSWGAHGLWLQGRVEEAREWVHEAEAIASELGHPFSEMQAAAYRSISYQLERDIEISWDCAELTVAGCARHNIAYYREWGVIVGGWVLGQRGELQAGLARIKQGLVALQ